MKKAFKKYVLITIYTMLLALFMAGALMPFIGWIIEPELTKMQIFLKYWWAPLTAMLSGVLMLLLKDK